MRKVFIMIMILLLCGCSTSYQLTIDGNSIQEQIDFSVDKSKIVADGEGPDDDIYSVSSINNLQNGELNPLNNNGTAVYEKNVIDNGNRLDVTLRYAYEENQIRNSRVLNECFENSEIIANDDRISINLSGKFYCYDEYGGTMEFKIVTNNKINSVNVSHGISDNEYVWMIDSSNYQNVDIQIDVSTTSKTFYYSVLIFAAIFGVVLLIIILFAVAKLSNRKKINEV